MTRATRCQVRMFRVGFGDCFLVSLGYATGPGWHVLIDFGSTRRAVDGPDAVEIATQIAAAIGSDPWIIVATHRHKDHISGFSGKSWEVLRPLAGQVRLVLQPWTEAPGLAGDATAPGASVHERGLAAVLAAMPVQLRRALEFADRHAAALADTVVDEVRFVADDNLPNPEAIRNLASFGRRCRYLRAGDRRVADAIPGVKLHVLGPPTIRQWAALRHRAARDGEYWNLRGAMTGVVGTATTDGPPLARRRDRPAAATAGFQARVTQALGHQVLGLVRALDASINNTSLILLFEIGDAVLLFPGDAQIENWSFALADPVQRKALERVSFYKVGHHGSLNATPHSLWDHLAHRRGSKPHLAGTLQTALSTLAGVHGSRARGTEVPRSTLVDALAAGSRLARTDVGGGAVTIIDVPVRRKRG